MAVVLSRFRSRVRLVAARWTRRLSASAPNFTPHRVCIIGSGPAGFYTAHRLLKVAESVCVELKPPSCELYSHSYHYCCLTALQACAAHSAPLPCPQLCPAVEVDILERLPVPYGLVRFGVAPDHPEVKVGAWMA